MKKKTKSRMKTCEACYLNKMPKIECGKLPMKDSALGMKVLIRVCNDAVGRWEISVMEHQKRKRGHRKKIRSKAMTIHAMTMIDEEAL